jgi:hypothetical protein
MDDYSDDVWIYEQIAADRRNPEGRVFFHREST